MPRFWVQKRSIIHQSYLFEDKKCIYNVFQLFNCKRELYIFINHWKYVFFIYGREELCPKWSNQSAGPCWYLFVLKSYIFFPDVDIFFYYWYTPRAAALGCGHIHDQHFIRRAQYFSSFCTSGYTKSYVKRACNGSTCTNDQEDESYREKHQYRIYTLQLHDLLSITWIKSCMFSG